MPEEYGPPADLAPEQMGPSQYDQGMGPPMSPGDSGGQFFNQPDPGGTQQPQQQQPQGPQEQGGEVAPTNFLDSAQKTLYGEYLALHGDGAAVKLQELDRAAKFRRALSMITETYATITGRPDVAAQARASMVEEDHKRAAQVESQILAKVGMAAIDREGRNERVKDEMLNLKLAAQEQKQHITLLQNAEKAARSDIRNRSASADGQPPDFEKLVEAKHRMFLGDSSFQDEFDRTWPVDELRAIQDRAAAKTKGNYGGAAGDERIRVGGAIAGATAQSRKNVETDPENVTKEADRVTALTTARKKVEALFKTNDPKPGGYEKETQAALSKIKSMTAGELKKELDANEILGADVAANLRTGLYDRGFMHFTKLYHDALARAYAEKMAARDAAGMK